MRSAESKRLDMLHGPIWSKLPAVCPAGRRNSHSGTAVQRLRHCRCRQLHRRGQDHCRRRRRRKQRAHRAHRQPVHRIALGANVVIANAVGRGDREAVQKAVHTSIVFSLLGGIVVAVLGELAAAALLRTLHVPDDVFPQALLYLRIYLMGMPVILLYNFEAAIFRSVGETRVPARGAGDVRCAERAAEPVLRCRAPYDRQRRGHRDRHGQCLQLGSAVPPPAALRQGHPP